MTYEQGIWTFLPIPAAAGFMVTVEASESGPTEVQRNFFLTIRDGLADCELRARDFLRSRVDAGVDVSQLAVYSIEIGSDAECRGETFVLEMSDADASVIHRVSFRGSQPQCYGFDD
jgi:hypothetical protein